MAKIVLGFLALAYLSGCASGHCRGQQNLTEAAKTQVGKDEEDIKEQQNKRVKIFKADGSLQCGMGQALTPQMMAKQLAGITIYSMISQEDGFMHIQACGTPTGQINVFEISMVDLEKANKLGFKEWKN